MTFKQLIEKDINDINIIDENGFYKNVGKCYIYKKPCLIIYNLNNEDIVIRKIKDLKKYNLYLKIEKND